MIERNRALAGCCAVVNTPFQTLGENIRHFRQGLSLSQEELADRCQLHRTYLSDLERGLRNPSFRSLLALAHGLGVRLSELTANVEVTD